MGKCLPAMWETWVQSLGQEDPLEEEMATHSSMIADEEWCFNRQMVKTITVRRQASLSITNSWSSLKLMSIVLVMPSSHLILCRPLLLLPPIPPSEVFLGGRRETLVSLAFCRGP